MPAQAQHTLLKPTIGDIMRRIAAIESEMITPGKLSFPYFWKSINDFPYWTNRISDFSIESDGKPNYKVSLDVTARIVVGHLTQGYDGQNEEELWNIIERGIIIFTAHPMLMSAKFKKPIDYVDEVYLNSGRGYAIFSNSPGQQIGAEFVLSTTIELTIEDEDD